jgi:hypothetical protein
VLCDALAVLIDAPNVGSKTLPVAESVIEKSRTCRREFAPISDMENHVDVYRCRQMCANVACIGAGRGVSGSL